MQRDASRRGGSPTRRAEVTSMRRGVSSPRFVALVLEARARRRSLVYQPRALTAESSIASVFRVAWSMASLACLRCSSRNHGC